MFCEMHNTILGCDKGHHLFPAQAQVRTPGSLQDFATLVNLRTVDFCKHKTRVYNALCATAVTCVFVALTARRAAVLANMEDLWYTLVLRSVRCACVKW